MAGGWCSLLAGDLSSTPRGPIHGIYLWARLCLPTVRLLVAKGKHPKSEIERGRWKLAQELSLRKKLPSFPPYSFGWNNPNSPRRGNINLASEGEDVSHVLRRTCETGHVIFGKHHLLVI